MDAPDFIKAAIDPDQWLTKSAALRRSGNRLWDSFFEETLRYATEQRQGSVEAADKSFSEALEYLTSSKFLYGLALETAFKADLIRRRPSDIEFRLSADGTGTIQSAELKQFGVQMGSGHNLEQLGLRTGILTTENNPVFKHDSDISALREILRHLSEVVYWSGRYPVPTRSGEGQKPSPEVPLQAYAHYMRDWLDPVLDYFQGSHAPKEDFGEHMSRIAQQVLPPARRDA
jgi:hypothetical protein